MNKRRALILHELRLMKWFLIGGGICVLVFMLWLGGDLASNVPDWIFSGGYANEGYRGSYFSGSLLRTLQDNHIIVILLLAAMVTVQFRDMHGRKREEYMSSLPYTRRERFIIKALTGGAVLFVVWGFLSAGLLILRQNVIGEYQKQALLVPFCKELLANETIWHTLRTLGIFGLELLTMYTIFVMLHAMVNKSVAASVFGLGIMMAPIVLAYSAVQWYANITGKALPDIGGWQHLSMVFMGRSLAVDSERWVQGSFTQYYYIQYWPMWQVALMLAVILLICLVVIGRLSKGQDTTRNAVIVSHKGVRLFLAAGIGVCMGAFCGLVFPARILPIANEFGTIVMRQIIGSSVFGFISWKLMKCSIR